MSDWRTAIRELESRLDLQHQVAPYAPYSYSGVEDGRPMLHLDDVSAIPFLIDIAGVAASSSNL